MSSRVSGLDLLRVSAVLEQSTRQLDILKNITPVMRENRPGAEGAADSHMKVALKSKGEDLELSGAMEKLHLSQTEHRPTLQESRSPLAKVEKDRQVMVQVISDLLAELQESGTFHSLVRATKEEMKKSEEVEHLHNTVIREELRIKSLKKQLVKTEKETTSEIQALEAIRSQLEVELQQISIKTSLEKRNATSNADLIIYQGKKMASQKEQELEDEKTKLLAETEEEIKVHMKNESFHKANHTCLQKKVEYWMERYKKETQAKDQELNSLKTQRANTLAQLHSLAKQCREMERIITEDRLEKENLRQLREREKLERAAATKIQAWWRGTLVRSSLVSKKNTTKEPKGSKKREGKRK